MAKSNWIRDEIIESAARAFYVSWWANEQENKKGFRGFGGGDLIDIAPRTPRNVLTFARAFIADFEKTNGVRADQMYERAKALAEAPGGMHYARRDPSPDLFGHYTAMQAMGHGVAWSDDYPEHGFKIPRAEYYGPGSRY